VERQQNQRVFGRGGGDRTQRSHVSAAGPGGFLSLGSRTKPALSQKCRNVQRTCNEFASNVGLKTPKSCPQNGLDGGPGESRTPDQRFRNWAVIPQPVCFQCLQFGQLRAVLGLVGSRTCNRSCNAGRGWPSLSISQTEIGSSIKRDVNKKTSPSAGREIFCLDIQPTVCRWLSIAREVLLWIALPFPRFIFRVVTTSADS
jgi:hypothetical protein